MSPDAMAARGVSGQVVQPGINRFTGRPNSESTSSTAAITNQVAGSIGQALPEAISNNAAKLQYPLVNPDRYKGTISFQAYKVIPPKDDARLNVSEFFDATKKGVASLASNITRERDATNTTDLGQTRRLTPDAMAALASERAKQKTNKEFNFLKIDPIRNEKCNLYLPLSYVVNDNMNYNTPDLGVLGGAITSAITGGAGLTQSLQQGLADAGRSFFDFFQNGSISSDLARLAAVRALNTIRISDTIKNAVSLAGQVTVNPNTRALFDRVVLREFNFQFKFIPKSREEALQVRKIIQFFRKHAYPETIDPGGLPIGYRFPNLFHIQLKYDNQQVGTKIKLCYLRNIQTNYNPGQASFHAGGDGIGAAPVETDLSLTFVENKTLSRDDILNGANYAGAVAAEAGGGF